MKRKQESGITLLVLVITIIIIIILASITMNMVFGENGLVEKAELAKNMTEEGTQKEQGDLANIAIWLNEVIYGEDSGEDTGANEEEPGTNNIDTNEIDTNSVETNTVEPPPVEIPDGDEEGAIIFGTPTWGEGKASVTISTDTEYKIEYQKNVTTGKWTELEMAEGTKQGIVTDLTHGEIIYARLTDGINTGKETSIRITDSVVPQVTVTPGTITSSTIKVEIETVDNESGMQEIVNYTYYIKKSTEGDGNYRNDGNNTNANFTFTGLEQGTSYDIKIEVQGDKAGNIGIGTLTEQRTQSIPGGETGLEEGAIKFGTPIWSNGTASVSISTNTSYTIEYQKGTGAPEDGSWQPITNNESITGINHNETVYARLTDGVNYGEYASITIKDTQEPTLEISQDVIKDKSITVTINAVDNETGLAEVNTYKFYLDNVEKATTTEATYTFDGLTPATPYSIKVEAYDKAGNKGEKATTVSTKQESIPTTTSYVGHYADVDGNGTVDGIIYADLAVGGSGQWSDGFGRYTIPKQTNLKEYQISQKGFTDTFGTSDVIAPIEGQNDKNDRFYVMALTDIDEDEYYWYFGAYNKMSIDTSEDFGKGKQNTQTMISQWNSEEYSPTYQDDMWGLSAVQSKINENPAWFVPSKEEWSAFAEKLGITEDNYSGKGLSYEYWSSSQNGAYSVWTAEFYNGCIGSNRVDLFDSVRLSATF